MASTTTSTPRDQAGSLTLEAPPPRSTAAENAKTEVLECGGNAQLMEARLCQITSSMRALIRSNRELEEALVADPDDADFLQAIAENQLTIRRQGHVAVALVQEMQARGCNVELEEDIRTAAEAWESNDGITAMVFGASSTEGQQQAAESEGNNNADTSNTDQAAPGGDSGMYL